MHSSLKSFVSAITAAGVLLLIGGAAAASASASGSTTGTVHVWVTPGSGAVDKILLTGVIGDHGTATSINKDGTVNANGEYVKGGTPERGVRGQRRGVQHAPSEVAAVAQRRHLHCMGHWLGTGDPVRWDGSLRRRRRHGDNDYELCRNRSSFRDRAEEGPMQHEQQR